MDLAVYHGFADSEEVHKSGVPTSCVVEINQYCLARLELLLKIVRLR